MAVEQIINFSRIDERLATSGQPEQDELAWIAESGFQQVINLALHDAEYALADEAGSIAGLGMAYHHIPVPWQRPGDEQLDRFFSLMDDNSTQRLFIHCAANRRVSVFLALYFMARQHWDATRAMDHIHSIWTPDDVWLLFLNQQMQRLGL